MNEGEQLVGDEEVEGNMPTPQQTPTPNSRTSSSKAKTAELMENVPIMSTGTVFGLCGRFIGKWPLPFVLVTFLICSNSFGIISLKLRDNVRDGYTPSTSRARLENEIYREFLGSEGDPVMTTIIMVAKNGDSMVRPSYLTEAVKQWTYISKELSVEGDNSTDVINFAQFCGHYCEANSVVKYFLDAYNKKMENITRPGYNLTFPISTIMQYKIHMERNFFGVEMATKESPTFESKYNMTDIKYVKVVAMAAITEVKTLEDFERMGKWELEVFRYCREYTSNKTNKLEMHVIGAEIVDTEMNKEGQKMTPYLSVGFSSMLVFVMAAVFSSAYYYGFFGWRCLIIGVCCSLVPGFAIATTLGLNNLLGKRTNSPMLIMPFLINGIGVNDVFLTLHAWMRQPVHIPAPEKLARVMQEVGPSITTTTITNVVTFLIGYLSPTEEMSIFCMGCAMALFFAYLFTITFFSPMLVFLLNEKTSEPISRQSRGKLRKVLDIYSKFISHKAVFAILMLGAAVYWGFGVLGTVSINAKLDTAKILPLDTPIRKPNRLIEEYVWKEFYPVNVIVNKPVNITNSTELAELERMIAEFENLPECRGSEFSISWLRDYQTYFFGVGAEDFDYDTGIIENTSLYFNFDKLEGFLGSPVFKHHRGALHLNFSEPIPVSSFQLTLVYQNSTSWEDRVDIMTKWRGIVDSYPGLNASVWNVNAMFVDQMLSLKPLAVQNVTVTLACMAVVCLVFIQNPTSVVTATLAILSIALGVTGYLSFWDLDLDPVTLCAVLVSIGMAVDFVAHTTYHYQSKFKEKEVGGRIRHIPLNTPHERISYTLANIAWPMTQAGISTVLCILPLVHLQNYLPLVFVKTITLVVIWGMFHGLVLLPAILAQFPLRWFNYNCNNFILGGNSAANNSEPDSEDDGSNHEMQPLAAND